MATPTQHQSTMLRQAFSILGGSALLLSTLGIGSARAETTETFESANVDSPLLAQIDLQEPQRTPATPTGPVQDQIPPLRTRLPMRGSIAPLGRGESVAITLRNNTASQLTYEAIATTDQRILAPGEEVTLSSLEAPTTISYWKSTGELTHAAVVDVDRFDNEFTVEFTNAEYLRNDAGSIVLLETGNIYIY
jgi:hypothetical protein